MQSLTIHGETCRIKNQSMEVSLNPNPGERKIPCISRIEFPEQDEARVPLYKRICVPVSNHAKTIHKTYSCTFLQSWNPLNHRCCAAWMANRIAAAAGINVPDVYYYEVEQGGQPHAIALLTELDREEGIESIPFATSVSSLIEKITTAKAYDIFVSAISDLERQVKLWTSSEVCTYLYMGHINMVCALVKDIDVFSKLTDIDLNEKKHAAILLKILIADVMAKRLSEEIGSCSLKHLMNQRGPRSIKTMLLDVWETQAFISEIINYLKNENELATSIEDFFCQDMIKDRFLEIFIPSVLIANPYYNAKNTSTYCFLKSNLGILFKDVGYSFSHAAQGVKLAFPEWNEFPVELWSYREVNQVVSFKGLNQSFLEIVSPIQELVAKKDIILDAASDPQEKAILKGRLENMERIFKAVCTDDQKDDTKDIESRLREQVYDMQLNYFFRLSKIHKNLIEEGIPVPEVVYSEDRSKSVPESFLPKDVVYVAYPKECREKASYVIELKDVQAKQAIVKEMLAKFHPWGLTIFPERIVLSEKGNPYYMGTFLAREVDLCWLRLSYLNAIQEELNMKLNPIDLCFDEQNCPYLRPDWEGDPENRSKINQLLRIYNGVDDERERPQKSES